MNYHQRPDRLTGLGSSPASPAAKYQQDEVVYQPGDRASCIYRVETGVVRVYRIFPNGRRYILSFHSAGQWFGLENERFHQDFAEAVTACELSRLIILDLDPAPATLLPFALESLTAARERHSITLCQTAVGRLSRFILDMADGCKRTDFDLVMSRADIADYLGITVEAVARSFTLLSKERVIRVGGFRQRNVRIVNLAKLREVMEERQTKRHSIEIGWGTPRANQRHKAPLTSSM